MLKKNGFHVETLHATSLLYAIYVIVSICCRWV